MRPLPARPAGRRGRSGHCPPTTAPIPVAGSRQGGRGQHTVRPQHPHQTCPAASAGAPLALCSMHPAPPLNPRGLPTWDEVHSAGSPPLSRLPLSCRQGTAGEVAHCQAVLAPAASSSATAPLLPGQSMPSRAPHLQRFKAGVGIKDGGRQGAADFVEREHPAIGSGSSAWEAEPKAATITGEHGVAAAQRSRRTSRQLSSCCWRHAARAPLTAG